MKARPHAYWLLAVLLACAGCMAPDRTLPTGSVPEATETPGQVMPTATTRPAEPTATVQPTVPAPTPTLAPSVQEALSVMLRFTAADGKPVEQEVNYLLYTPAGYGQAAIPPNGWPLILFLHGQLEWGDDPTVLTRQGVPKLLAEGHDLPALVVSPQSREGKRWWPQTAMLVSLLDAIESQYVVDPQRVYLTGISMGGYGAWALAMAEAGRFAAVVPIAGGADYLPGDTPIPESICNLRDVPVWAFHGELDLNVPASASINAVRALEKCGGNPRLTLYADAAHNEAWERAYADPALWTWLFEQVKQD